MTFDAQNLLTYLRRLVVRLEANTIPLNRYDINEGLTSIQITLTILGTEAKPMTNYTITVPHFTASERRTLLRLVDDKWEDINRMRPRDGTYLDQSDVLYLQTLEAIQQKLKS